ncbi:hydantoinase/oxoprolinase family protein, partial [Nonomuraea sp. NPDC049784]|uniref:hydantoinase/oxoprolinase family protein n=1 Tax=Nonomuraea sp. NPDC049784 TaxID=3154361 RepID=UPI0033CA34FA
RGGVPRESTVAVSLGGVRSNFRMPDVLSLGIGGGSVVHDDGRRVGPDSVGYRLTSEALVFGGDTLTLTDIAVAAGLADIGDASRVADVPESVVQAALADVRTRIGAAIDQAKLAAADLPVIVVGGGGVVIDELPGITTLLRPAHSGVANAVGAAFAQVGGEVDKIYTLAEMTRAQVVSDAREEAVRRAVKAGAVPETVRIVDTEDVPLTHMAGGTALRVKAKAVGELRREEGN